MIQATCKMINPISNCIINWTKCWLKVEPRYSEYEIQLVKPITWVLLVFFVLDRPSGFLHKKYGTDLDIGLGMVDSLFDFCVTSIAVNVWLSITAFVQASLSRITVINVTTRVRHHNHFIFGQLRPWCLDIIKMICYPTTLANTLELIELLGEFSI